MMILAYGKIRKHLKQAYDNIHTIEDEDLLEALGNSQIGTLGVGVFVLLATDYSATGAKGKALREALETYNERVPIVLLAETERLLRTKPPESNNNIHIVIEKSKKVEVIRHIIDPYLNTQTGVTQTATMDLFGTQTIMPTQEVQPAVIGIVPAQEVQPKAQPEVQPTVVETQPAVAEIVPAPEVQPTVVKALAQPTVVEVQPEVQPSIAELASLVSNENIEPVEIKPDLESSFTQEAIEAIEVKPVIEQPIITETKPVTTTESSVKVQADVVTETFTEEPHIALEEVKEPQEQSVRDILEPNPIIEVQSHDSLFNYTLATLPDYTPLCFNEPKDILLHLKRKRGL